VTTALSVLRSNPKLLVGLTIVVVIALLAVLAPLVAGYGPEEVHPNDTLVSPNSTYWLGTDVSGMDVFSRLIYAPRIDLTIALGATLIAIGIGTPWGLLAGYYHHPVSELSMRIADILQSFPVLVLGMALVALTGQQIGNVVLAIGIVNAPVYARLVRSQAMHISQRLFIEGARAAGASDLTVVFRHLLPNSSAPIFAMASVTMGTAMLLTAGLSFIGAGVRVPTPEWGSMIAVGASSLTEGGAWWPSVFPGLILSITVIGFGLIGDSLVEITDPRQRNGAGSLTMYAAVPMAAPAGLDAPFVDRDGAERASEPRS
jgi:peptide/nickel transport system permease protein